MRPAADALAAWATEFEPSVDDLRLARRSLLDTLAVMFAAREEPIRELLGPLSETGRWAALAHVLDFDDLHMASTAHISAVCAPAALATEGGARAYLAGAGAMARLGTALGWPHYTAGWHTTCTAGAPAAAITAAIAHGLDAERTAAAIALAIPAAGGLQRAFGTAAKPLQVAFAAEAGVRAAALAAAGAGADPGALDDWIALVGGDAASLELDGPAVPGGLAIKLFPCCYALQRPIAALMTLTPLDPERVRGVAVRTPTSSVVPLIHRRPTTGLEGKFSLQYGLAATLLDGRPGLASFTDAGVGRPDAQRLIQAVELESRDRGDHLLAGEVDIEVRLADGTTRRAALALPPGAPDRPPTDSELREKLESCAPGEADALAGLTWETAALFLRGHL